MKILILGSEGFIGSHCVRYFKSKGNEIYGVDLFEQPSNDYEYRKVSRLSFEIETFLTDVDFDLIINASGSGNVSLSMDHPLIDFESNCLDLMRILDAVRKFSKNTKIIHFSSAAIYGNPSHLPVKESDSSNPLSAYGWHKLISEHICKEYVQLYGLKMTILRPFSVYGPGLKKQIFWDVFNRMKNASGNIELMGTGKESRDFIHIDDLLRAIQIIVLHSPMNGDVYNVASGNETKIEDAIRLLVMKLGANKEITFNNKLRHGDPKNWEADITKLNELGFSPEIPMEAGLEDLCLWLKKISQ